VPRISEGGVSDVNVDPDYVAPPGMAPADAIDQGIPSAGEQDDEQDSERDATPDDVARPTVGKVSDDGDAKNAPKSTPARKTK
jgi:hypothetical protein